MLRGRVVEEPAGDEVHHLAVGNGGKGRGSLGSVMAVLLGVGLLAIRDGVTWGRWLGACLFGVAALIGGSTLAQNWSQVGAFVLAAHAAVVVALMALCLTLAGSKASRAYFGSS